MIVLSNLEDKQEQQDVSTDNKTKTPQGTSKFIWEILQTLLIAFLIIKFVTQTSLVVGECMLPLLKDGDRILVNKFVYHFKPIKRGDIIVFKFPKDPSKEFIKRVIGLPGDHIKIVNGQVFINGKKLNEPYVKFRSSEVFPPGRSEFVVPANSFFVMGDNRPNSLDSRFWGTVPKKLIVGKAFWRFWPCFENASFVKNLVAFLNPIPRTSWSCKRRIWLDGGEKWREAYGELAAEFPPSKTSPKSKQ